MKEAIKIFQLFLLQELKIEIGSFKIFFYYVGLASPKAHLDIIKFFY